MYKCRSCPQEIARFNYCSRECTRSDVSHADIMRMLEQVAHDPKLGCWTWLGQLSNGYPVISINKQTTMTRRFSAKAFLGVDYGAGATQIKVYAVCQNKACVRPDHIIWATSGIPTSEQEVFALKHQIEFRVIEIDEARQRLTDLTAQYQRQTVRTCSRCSQYHAVKPKYCMAAPTIERKIQEFYNDTDIQGEHWLWVGRTAKTNHTFGVIPINGHLVPATRFAKALLEQGAFTLDSPQVVRRTCAERDCVNPTHLEAVEKGSWNTQYALSEEDRRELGGERRALGTSYAKLGKDYGISAMTARKIAKQEDARVLAGVQ